MNQLGVANYDPGVAVSKSTASLLAMTAMDTTNLSITITVPSHGKVKFRMFCNAVGANTSITPAGVLLGVLNGSTVVCRMQPKVGFGTVGATAGTIKSLLEAEFTATGLTPGVTNFNLAFGVEGVLASSNIKYGGPDNTTSEDAFGAAGIEAWDPQPLPTVTPGTATGLPVIGPTTLVDATPVIEEITSTTDSALATSHTVNMPATVNYGDLLILIESVSAPVSVVTPAVPTGWSLLVSSSGSNLGLGTFSKIADGTEGGTTFSASTGAVSTRLAAQIYRIRRGTWDGSSLNNAINANLPAGGTSTTPTPAGANGYGTTQSTLFIAAEANKNDSVTVSSYPTNYSGGTQNKTSAIGADGAELATCYRLLATAGTETPGVFTISSSVAWRPVTIAIKPGNIVMPLSTDVVRLAGGSAGATNLGAIYSAFETGTAQAGGASTITLRSGASAVDNFFKDQVVFILSGTGAGQTNRITGYVGATKVATVETVWATQPDSTSVYLVVGRIG